MFEEKVNPVVEAAAAFAILVAYYLLFLVFGVWVPSLIVFHVFNK